MSVGNASCDLATNLLGKFRVILSHGNLWSRIPIRRLVVWYFLLCNSAIVVYTPFGGVVRQATRKFGGLKGGAS